MKKEGVYFALGIEYNNGINGIVGSKNIYLLTEMGQKTEQARGQREARIQDNVWWLI